METIKDFEDMLFLLAKHSIRYLIIGGLAFIFHAKPRYTKDMDLWIDPDTDNVTRANHALSEFGSPFLLDNTSISEILQIGLAPDRIDFLFQVSGLDFTDAWPKRIEGFYGETKVHWIDLDSLILIKNQIDHPRHKEDVRVLLEVKKMLKQ